MTQNRPPPYMSTFTELKIGRVPITEEGVDRYQISDSVLNHFSELSSLEDLNTSVGRIWTEMKVPLPWLQICTANYIVGTIEFNNPAASSLEVRGWIDSVEPVSDTEDYPVCRVKWHFDFWEMYKAVACYGYGQVKRRPYRTLDTTPIQNYQHVYKKIGAKYDISYSPELQFFDNPKRRPWWVILAKGTPEDGDTQIQYLAWPVWPSIDATAFYLTMGATDQNAGRGPNLSQVCNGLLDEIMDFPPSLIYGVWISPLSPVPGTFTGSRFVPSFSPTYIDVVKDNATYRAILIERGGSSDGILLSDRVSPLTLPITSSEGHEYGVIGPDGSIAGMLPYGVTVKKIRMGFNLSVTDAAIMIQFVRDETVRQDLRPEVYDSGGRNQGLLVSVPLPVLPVNENAWSEYMYTGQRDYDRRIRQLNTNASGVSNVVNGAIGGGIAGGFSEKGALIGAAAGAASGLLTYGVETFYANDEIQKAEDRLRSHQSPGILFSGDGFYCCLNGPGLELAEIVYDDYSESQLQNTRSNYGISVDEILGSCDSLIRQESPRGFYQIPNLIISGPLPVEAKDTIKQKFSAGVRLI